MELLTKKITGYNAFFANTLIVTQDVLRCVYLILQTFTSKAIYQLTNQPTMLHVNIQLSTGKGLSVRPYDGLETVCCRGEFVAVTNSGR
jgi:hypothetical protein